MYSRCGYCNCPECQRRDEYWYCEHLEWNICKECCIVVSALEDGFVECDGCDNKFQVEEYTKVIVKR